MTSASASSWAMPPLKTNSSRITPRTVGASISFPFITIPNRVVWPFKFAGDSFRGLLHEPGSIFRKGDLHFRIAQTVGAVFRLFYMGPRNDGRGSDTVGLRFSLFRLVNAIRIVTCVRMRKR